MMRIVDLDGDGKMKFSEFTDLMKVLLPDIKEKPQKEEVTKLMVMTIVKTLKTFSFDIKDYEDDQSEKIPSH